MKWFLTLLTVLFLAVASGSAQDVSITPVRIPDIPGYRTLKCDLHMHSVFSDGDVWPDFRVVEAVAEGLDAIAMTEHIEYLPKKDHLGSDRNKSSRIAQASAGKYGLIVIPGSEITRSMPPGHLNAIFVQDANALATEHWQDALAEAKRQGALVFWNHPGWKGQQPDGVARWYDEHTELLTNGTLWGMEIVNQNEFYPEVMTWCREKGLAMLGNSDTHHSILLDVNRRGSAHRPMTLVFARTKSLEGIREALDAKRTAVYYRGQIYGDGQWLRQIFERSVAITPQTVTMAGRDRAMLAVENTSALTYHLVRTSAPAGVDFPGELTLQSGEIAMFTVRPSADTLSVSGPVTARYQVKELITAPGECAEVPLTITVHITPKSN